MQQSIHNVREEIEELRSSVTTLRAEVRRMETCIESFRTQYEPLLKGMAASSTYWSSMRREVITHVIKGSAWAMIVTAVVIFAGSVRNWLKGLLS